MGLHRPPTVATRAYAASEGRTLRRSVRPERVGPTGSPSEIPVVGCSPIGTASLVEAFGLLRPSAESYRGGTRRPRSGRRYAMGVAHTPSEGCTWPKASTWRGRSPQDSPKGYIINKKRTEGRNAARTPRTGYPEGIPVRSSRRLVKAVRPYRRSRLKERN